VRWVLTPIGIFLLARVGVAITTPGLQIAVWWPAAGLAVWFALRTPRHQRVFALLIIFVLVTTANAASGRPLQLSLVYGMANALEVALILLLLQPRGRPFALASLTDALRLVLVVGLASLGLGFTVGAAGSAVLGSDPVAAALMAAVSHFSAILLIAPFALLPPRIPQRTSGVEIAIVSVLLAAAVFVAFGPGATLPLGFLVFAVLAWGAKRFPAIVTFIQAVVVSVTVLVLTVLGHGSFIASTMNPVQTAITTVVFISAVAVFTVVLGSARYESQAAAHTVLETAHARADAERERAAALQDRLELERQREDFISTTSHELRTPITSITGYAELLSETGLDEDEQSWVGAIERNAVRLTQLVEDLLWLGRAREQLRGEIQPVRVSTAEIAAEVITTVRPLADTRSITLEAAETELAVTADRADLARILDELVSNALKFTPEGGRVSIDAAQLDGRVSITVEDTGPGMSPETLAHAFDRFYRGADASARSAAGTGLGLAIARDLAARNDGILTLSAEPGRGVQATISIPAAP